MKSQKFSKFEGKKRVFLNSSDIALINEQLRIGRNPIKIDKKPPTDKKNLKKRRKPNNDNNKVRKPKGKKTKR